MTAPGMRYRRLGRTGLTVSEIGFGAWGIGGASGGAAAYGPTDDAESLRVLVRALERGVTFYDTAELYGAGRSERLIGAAFKDRRAQVIVASKVGMADGGLSQDFSPEHIRDSLQRTLKRLQTNYLDLYQLHDPSVASLEQDGRALDTLRALQRAGMIRAYGISARSPEEAVAAVQRLQIPCVQVNLNLLDQRAAGNGLMALCETQQVGLIARTPLCFGFLTAAYTRENDFGADDHRSGWPAQQRARWAHGHQVFASVKQRQAQSWAQFALRYCLSYEAVSTVIPGMLYEAHVQENVAASALGPLEAADRLAVEQAYQGERFFLGREAAAAS